ncbi:MAG: amidohydrolase family protein [Rikenellaceae bacterium]
MSYSYLRTTRRIASNLMLLDGEFIPRPLIEISDQGEVLCVEQYENVDRLENTEFYAGIMTPGFVNSHCHLELSYLKGRIEPYGGFAHFARSIGEVRGEATMEQRLSAIKREDLRMRGEGVVAVGDIMNGDSTMGCKSQSTIRYRNFAEVFGLRTESLQHMSWADSCENSSLTTHSIYSLSDVVFKDIASQNVDAPLSIHFMESPGESELYQRRGHLWEWYQRVGYECDFLHYGSPAQRIIESVPAHRSVVLVHNCCVTQRDIDIIVGHFTAPIYWVVCPRSNNYISRLVPPLNLLRRNRLNICVGTDSLASNHSLSMVAEMAAMESAPLVERLDWSTCQGAKALGFEDLGELKVGRCCGINIVSGVDYQTMQFTSKSKVLVVV